MRCPRSRRSRKEAGQQRPLKPSSCWELPSKGLDLWLPGLDLVLIHRVTLDKSPNFSGPEKFLFSFLFILPL